MKIELILKGDFKMKVIKEFVEKVKTNKKKILKQVLIVGATIGGTLLTVKLLTPKEQNLIEGGSEGYVELPLENEELSEETTESTNAE